MAIYIQNNVLTGGDFVRYTYDYSSSQSLHKARKKGFVQTYPTGRRSSLTFAPPDTVAKVHGVSTWQGLPLSPGNSLPEGLTSLRSAAKKMRVAEITIMGWAVLHLLDVYWAAGHFWVRPQDVKQVVHAEAERIKALEPVTRTRNKRRKL
ncbi:MAG: hypothetical protein IPN22_09550 [Bacteroidetes bacterium]|nr:hypothetical protein [Bacteroidota bacterium]